ncbi:alpha/beta fold hydrolase [Verticiella sediminum]|uniref:alpha/beta fold hydrolase n=1 Tax=Verticiella sediminum TaxID=1247510 RepID=UPI001B885421|nr:alpha/beta fold hydrolase [Verticiella sediminum]
MPKAICNGVGIHYEISAPENSKPIILIGGVGTQLTRWSEPFVQTLAAHGFRVIRFDNRDIGLSDGHEDAGVPDFRAVLAAKARGEAPAVPYTLDDMADDVAALLDHLQIERAHVAGASMGGMIAQLVAIRHPQRTASLTSIMSSTGNPDLPKATDAASQALTGRRADPRVDRAAFLDEAVMRAQVIGSPAHAEDAAELRARAEEDLDRAFRPDGFARQYAAILAAPDRRPALARLSVPTLVIHGADDPLVRAEGGRDTAAHVPGARLLEIAGMGHNIPHALNRQIADAIAELAARA